MAIKLIKSEQDYDEAISLLEAIGDNPNFENDENLIDEFELLEKLIGDYEKENFPIEKGDPIEIIQLKMNYMDLSPKDLIPYIGSKGVVSEVLSRKRGLSKAMIRKLSNFLNIDQSLLNVDIDNVNESKVIVLRNTKTNFEKKERIINPFGLDKKYLGCINIFSQRVKENRILLNVCSN